MILYLCEKPSQARDIGEVLGVTAKRDGYLEGKGRRVTWCIGHLLEMITPDGYKPEWKTWRLDTLPLIPEQWQLEVTARGKKQFHIIKNLLQEAAEVVLATDADREGETIGREVLERCHYRGKISRLWLSALDEASIRKALDALLPGEKTAPLYRAGLGRSRADWIVGMNLSRAYTILGRQGGYDGVLTVGRVQTPTLKLVVDRDRQIENFIPVGYFDLLVHLRVPNGRFKAKWIVPKKIADAEGRCLDRAKAVAVAQKVAGQSGKVEKAETKRMKEAPPLPLELSTLQQEASRRWGLSAKKTLEVAQSLYETHKAITYPRTDCRFLPNNQFDEAPKILQAMATVDVAMSGLVQAADPTLRSKAWDDKKITAHHAMIPTSARVNVGSMSQDESRLYDLIRRHYLAQFFPAFEYDRTVIDSLVQDETFRASGRVEKVIGWKQVLGGEKGKSKDQGDEEQKLPQVNKGETAVVEKTVLEEKQTKPPQRYTEGTLIHAMKNVGKLVEDSRLRKILRETAGIGTEATRASIIENLIKRNLLAKDGKKDVISMPVGRALVDMLPHSVTDPATTAVWEQALDDIAHSGGVLEEFLGKSEIWIHKLIANARARQSMGIAHFSGLSSVSKAKDAQHIGLVMDVLHPCPHCGRSMRRRKSGDQWFWGCCGYPACRATLPDKEGKPVSRPELPQRSTGPLCPLCNKGVLVERTAKKGQKAGNRFLGCNTYPECRHTQPVE
ncbi:MAG: DNA topoisomerase III [Magnetococcales bacterium]|nr:DNA topoisomerase III [Magnetococcales bacterium]HIJ85264.1 DNA topoisomerase 3 [Magnetococcales bacterium]